MASAMKHAPTILMMSLSLLSRRYPSASTDILQRSVAPDVTSMKLSIPKPTREMLPAIPPATTATRPSRLFHAIVKYSKRIPRFAILSRVVANSIKERAYQGAQGTCRRVIAKCILWMKAGDEAHLPLSCLSWKWRTRSSVKITERTYEEGTEAFHPRRKGSHIEAASFGQSARLGAV